MRKATITQLKNELSELLEIAKRGEPVLILDRNIPIVRMISASSPEFGSDADEARLAKLERSGLVRRGDAKVIRRLLKKSPPLKTRKKVNVVKALLDEREEKF